MSNSKQDLKIETINENFFGKEKTNRYIMDVYRECVEKLIITNTLIEVWARTKGAHEHTKGRNCSQCALYYQIYHSCTDSLFLHIRLLFSRKEPFLAEAFLNSINDLTVEDFKKYYDTKYEHTLNTAEIEAINELFVLAKTNLAELKSLYMKRIESYQSFAFHQPDDGKYYKVTTTQKKHQGIKFVKYDKRQKFKRDLASAKEMLDLFGDIIHAYLKLTSTYFHVLNLYPKNYVKEVTELLGVELDAKTQNDMENDVITHTEKMVHVLECSDGLNSHNGLEFVKIKSALAKRQC
jgi:hypothetical protein